MIDFVEDILPWILGSVLALFVILVVLGIVSFSKTEGEVTEWCRQRGWETYTRMKGPSLCVDDSGRLIVPTPLRSK